MEQTVEDDDPIYDDVGVFPLEEEQAPVAAPEEEVRSTQGGENETSMMSDF